MTDSLLDSSDSFSSSRFSRFLFSSRSSRPDRNAVELEDLQTPNNPPAANRPSSASSHSHLSADDSSSISLSSRFSSFLSLFTVQNALALCYQYLYYIRHSFTEMRRRKFQYFLGSFSCFLVVVIAAVCYTLIARAPVVFLQQAEADNGQFDLLFNPSGGAIGPFLNYSQFAANAASADYSLHSPRLVLKGSAFDSKCNRIIASKGINIWHNEWKYINRSRIHIPPSSNDTIVYDPFSCDSLSVECLPSLCPAAFNNPSLHPDAFTLYAIDSEREKKMAFGRLWPLGTIPPSGLVISESAARLRGLSVGDPILISLNQPDILWSLLMHHRNPLSSDSNIAEILRLAGVKYTRRLILTARVHSIIPSSFGKTGSTDTDFLFMEYSSLLDLVRSSLHPVLSERAISTLIQTIDEPETRNYFSSLHYSVSEVSQSLADRLLQSIDSSDILYQYASSIYQNLPGNRIAPYMDSNFDDIQSTLIKFSSGLIYRTGFRELDLSMPILSSLNDLKLFSLYLGLILSIILTILFILSTMLIYSLLMISIETKQFEHAVHRLAGMTRFRLVQLILVQAATFAIPAWAIGLIISQLIAASLLGSLEKDVEIPIDRKLSAESIKSATALGLLIPLFSSILPIRAALSKNLSDSLDTRHNKTKGVEFSIERSESSRFQWAWIALGSGMAILGFIIYYLLPLALLSFNLTLFFNVFFGLLLGMLFGLILLSLNFQQTLERIFTIGFFFWEKTSIRTLILKNLIAHRIRNRKTSLMFALSLGFIIFITVAYKMEIATARFRSQRYFAAPVSVYGGGGFAKNHIAEYESILMRSPIVEDFAWGGPRIKHADNVTSSTMSNLGHAFSNEENLYSVAPNFYECVMNEFLIPSQISGSPLSLSEQLYTPTGSQSVILPTSAGPQFGLTDLSADSSFLVNIQRAQPPSIARHRVRPLALLDLSPHYTMSRFPSTRQLDALISFPTQLRWSPYTFKSFYDIPMDVLMVKLRNGASDLAIDALITDLTASSDRFGHKLYDRRVFSNQLSKSDAVMSFLFDSATYIAMFLCLFSLMASMFTNIYEQTKEIAVLRAIGMRAFDIVKLYSYEAFILVLASSSLGVLIGGLMSWTMLSQRALFTQLPVSVPFPYSLMGFVLIGAIGCAFVASFIPARELMKKPISVIMRTII